MPPPQPSGTGLRGKPGLISPSLSLLSPQRRLRSLSQQEALQELQTWVDSAESRLEELLSRAESSRAELSRRLEECRVKKKKSELTLEQTDQQVFVAQDLQVEARSHQALVDLVDRPSHGCSTETDHRGRCEQNQFAEEQGRLSQRWLRLQAELSRQVRDSDWFRLFSSPWKQNRSYASGLTAGRTWTTFRFLSGVRMVPGWSVLLRSRRCSRS